MKEPIVITLGFLFYIWFFWVPIFGLMFNFDAHDLFLSIGLM